jgi:hypothetical protein
MRHRLASLSQPPTYLCPGESLILGKAHNDGNRVANASEHEGEDTAMPCQREAVTSRRKSCPDKCRVIVRCFFLHDLLILLRSLGASYNLSAAYTCLHMEKLEEDPSWERSRKSSGGKHVNVLPSCFRCAPRRRHVAVPGRVEVG